MKEKVDVLISEEQILKRTKEIADELNKHFKSLDDGRDIVLVCILKGSVMFFSELAKRLDIPVEMDFVICSSYGDSTTPGALKIQKDMDISAEGKHILLIEDIVDTGRTLKRLIEYLNAKNPASLTLCTLLDKPDRREYPVQADHVGFVVPDKFVVGFGLDYAQRYRNLPYIGVLSFIEQA